MTEAELVDVILDARTIKEVSTAKAAYRKFINENGRGVGRVSLAMEQLLMVEDRLQVEE